MFSSASASDLDQTAVILSDTVQDTCGVRAVEVERLVIAMRKTLDQMRDAIAITIIEDSTGDLIIDSCGAGIEA